MKSPKQLAALLLSSTLLISPAIAANSKSSATPYLELQPAIVVNLHGPGRIQFMQVEIAAMSRDSKVLAALEEHMGPMRDALITLLSAQTSEGMRDQQVREQVRLQALENLRSILETHAGFKRESLEALYFTNFVIQ
ncbi:MAG: flagellar basal body-associated FliL family protein [Thiohalomonadaceae bacterium]